MKRIIILAAILGLSFGLHAQTITKDSQGNYIAVKAIKMDDKGKDTGKTFTDQNGKTYPVYISKNGKLYYMRTSKSGNIYKNYIKID